MSVITGFFAYLAANSSQIFNLLLEHIRLTAIAVGVSILIGVPLGIFICYGSRCDAEYLDNFGF